MLAGVPDGAYRAEPGEQLQLSYSGLPRPAHLALHQQHPQGPGHCGQGSPTHFVSLPSVVVKTANQDPDLI